jgi:D-alanyl-D-alanine carboxypeptidase
VEGELKAVSSDVKVATVKLHEVAASVQKVVADVAALEMTGKDKAFADQLKEAFDMNDVKMRGALYCKFRIQHAKGTPDYDKMKMAQSAEQKKEFRLTWAREQYKTLVEKSVRQSMARGRSDQWGPTCASHASIKRRVMTRRG